MPTIVRSRRKEPHRTLLSLSPHGLVVCAVLTGAMPPVSVSCPYCKVELEYKAPGEEATFTIECAACKETFAGPQEKKKAKPGGRRMGTGELASQSTLV